MNRMNNWTNQRRGKEELSSGSSVNPRSARYRGAIAVFTYVPGTMEVHKQGTSEVHFMSRRCITYVRGTPAVYFAPPECPVAVQFPLCFYFLWINFKKSYCCNGGSENFETTCRLLVYAWSIGSHFWWHCPFNIYTYNNDGTVFSQWWDGFFPMMGRFFFPHNKIW
jgi:hypothetical protein